MLVIRRLFGTGTNCIAPSGLPLLLCLFPGLAPWAFLSRPCGASFAPETSLGPLGGHEVHKSVKFCIMAGAAMPRSYSGTGVSRVNDWTVLEGSVAGPCRGRAFLRSLLGVS